MLNKAMLLSLSDGDKRGGYDLVLDDDLSDTDCWRVSVSPETAALGDVVTVFIKWNDGLEMSSSFYAPVISVYKNNDMSSVQVTKAGSGGYPNTYFKYTFVYPGSKVTIDIKMVFDGGDIVVTP